MTSQSQAKEDTPLKATSPLEAKLIEDAKIAMALPIPDEGDYWVLSKAMEKDKKKRLFSLFSKSEVTDEKLRELREVVEKSPGRAKVKINELLKENSDNTDLIILQSICSYRMMLNSSNRKGILEGLKKATMDTANALMADGLSPYNCEVFINIYFGYLNKLKRFQASTYRSLSDTIRQQEFKTKLEVTIKKCDLLLDENKRVTKILNQIKGRFKSSNFNTPWKFSQIKQAANKVELNDYNYMCGALEARKLIIYTMALLDIFARIPMLNPLVDLMLHLIPEGTPDLYLRKASVQARQAFTQLDLKRSESNRGQMRALGRQIYKSNLEYVQRIENFHVKQTFEADPYFNVARLTIMTFGLYKAEEQNEMLHKSIDAMRRLVRLDMSENKIFAQVAEKLLKKLSVFLKEAR